MSTQTPAPAASPASAGVRVLRASTFSAAGVCKGVFHGRVLVKTVSGDADSTVEVTLRSADGSTITADFKHVPSTMAIKIGSYLTVADPIIAKCRALYVASQSPWSICMDLSKMEDRVVVRTSAAFTAVHPEHVVADMSIPTTGIESLRPQRTYHVLAVVHDAVPASVRNGSGAVLVLTGATSSIKMTVPPDHLVDLDLTDLKGTTILVINVLCGATHYQGDWSLVLRMLPSTTFTNDPDILQRMVAASALHTAQHVWAKSNVATTVFRKVCADHYPDLASALPDLESNADGNYVVSGVIHSVFTFAGAYGFAEPACPKWAKNETRHECTLDTNLSVKCNTCGSVGKLTKARLCGCINVTGASSHPTPLPLQLRLLDTACEALTSQPDPMAYLSNTCRYDMVGLRMHMEGIAKRLANKHAIFAVWKNSKGNSRSPYYVANFMLVSPDEPSTSTPAQPAAKRRRCTLDFEDE